MSHLNQVIKNAATGWLAILARLALALVLVPFLIGQLGKEGFGLIGLLSVILAMTHVADMGLRQALGRLMAEGVAREDAREMSELMSTGLVVYIVLAAGISALYVFGAPWLVDLFKVSPAWRTDAVLSVRIYGTAAVVLAFVTAVFTAGLAGHNRFDLVSYAEIAGGVASAVLILIVIPRVPGPLYGWIGVMLSVQAARLGLMARLFRKLCGNVRISAGNVSFGRLRPLFGMGSNLYLLQLSRYMAEQSHPLIVSHFYGPAGVALYNPGGKLANMLRPIVMTLGNQLYPLTTRHYLDGQTKSLERMLLMGTKYTLLLGVAACVIPFVFAEPFCRLWLQDSLGMEYTTAASVMKAWSVATFFMYMGGTQWSIGLGMDKLRIFAWVLFPTAILNIAASIYIVGYTRYGIPGVVLGTIVTEIFRRSILFTYCTRLLKIPFWRSARMAYARPWTVTLLLAGVAWLVHRELSIDSWPRLVLAVSLVGAAWLAGALAVGVTRQERNMILARVGVARQLGGVLPSRGAVSGTDSEEGRTDKDI